MILVLISILKLISVKTLDTPMFFVRVSKRSIVIVRVRHLVVVLLSFFFTTPEVLGFVLVTNIVIVRVLDSNKKNFFEKKV